MTVSLAAQIGTLPLSLYYFHQFPGLFLLTNLLVLPLIGLIMAVGVPLMMSAALGWVPQLGLTLITGLTQTLNSIVKTIASADSLVFKNIPFNFWMLCSVYLLIVCWALVFKKPQLKTMKWAIISILLVQLSVFISLWNAQQKRTWLVLHQKKATLILNQSGRSLHVFARGKISETAVQNYKTQEFIHQVNHDQLGHMTYFKNRKIVLIDAARVYPKNTQADIVLLCQSPRINLDRLLEDHKPKMIVADGSNYPSSVARWETSCQKQKIPFHYTGKKGFFELTD
jgi:competence protein ComEC